MRESANTEECSAAAQKAARAHTHTRTHTQSCIHIPESANTEKEWAAAEQKATGMQAMMSSLVVLGTSRASGAACSRFLSVPLALDRQKKSLPHHPCRPILFVVVHV